VLFRSDAVQVGQTVEALVTKIDTNKKDIQLSVKQATENPWDVIEKKYQIGQVVRGVVRGFVSYGSFIELPDGIEGLVYVKNFSWTKRISHPSESLQKGQQIDVMILSIDKSRKRLSFGIKQLQPNPWETVIAQKYAPGTVITGKVVKSVSFGAFVELEKDLEGLIHYSKLGQEQVSLAVGDVVEVSVDKVEPKEERISLMLVRIVEKAPAQEAAREPSDLQAVPESAASQPASITIAEPPPAPTEPPHEPVPPPASDATPEQRTDQPDSGSTHQ
jgi:small subunit ribosomal protein S1